ncbi:FAD-dependent pyridine nucleotide-disulfide oxidoreductase [Pandoraea terrae]|uniref:FAD-dependent pyridine nucleotide-disulfide oxidoreductase n=1 Tax=Pandoraea terrae TaxID=1537710 RepID=A0A5E4UYW3_9BURK|nr:NAD(P)/FAD-dependent oxidoreductase [Pandoraea terrae]VVE05147.1 FAD-dependent pyridine nucleotide-disulfide oxidoreductase [Pandoraea terrae]
MHRIVIVGGGAGGLELATRLGDTLGKSGRANVTLVDRCPTHIWKPLLHEVATGSLDTNAHQLEYAAQAHWHHFEFTLGELVGLDRASKSLRLAAVLDAESREEVLPPRELTYDNLVLALGSQTHFFGVPGAQANAIPLDTPEQAEKLRRRLLQTCIRKGSKSCEINFPGVVNVAIIGGGATGVELSAELRRMEKAFRKFGLHAANQESDINITLLEAGPRLLPALSPRVATITTDLLRKLGIQVSVGDPVTKVDRDSVTTKSGSCVPADITIWAAGIKAPDLLANLDGIEVNRINQVKVTRSLQSQTDSNIFAFGDCACCSWKDDRFVPPRAQAAHQQAAFLAKSLRARVSGFSPREFKYSDRGSLVSLGAASAVGNLMGGVIGGSIMIEGLIAKFMYAALYRKHLATVAGVRRMLIDSLVHGLRRVGMPRVKLH